VKNLGENLEQGGGGERKLAGAEACGGVVGADEGKGG
jgi:hypothetical protein